VGFSNAAFARVEALNSFPKAGTPVRGVSGILLACQVRLLRYPYVIVYAITDDEIRVGQFQRSVHGPGMMPGLSPDPDRWRTQDARSPTVAASPNCSIT
jgi:hypothetical protein